MKRIRLKKQSLKNYSFWFSSPSEKGQEIVTSPIFVFVSVENINFDVDYLEISWIALVLKVSKPQNELSKSSFHPKYEQKCQEFCPVVWGKKSWQFFVHILGETMTSKIPSEIYWPLKVRESQKLIMYLVLISFKKRKYLLNLTTKNEKSASVAYSLATYSYMRYKNAN